MTMSICNPCWLSFRGSCSALGKRLHENPFTGFFLGTPALGILTTLYTTQDGTMAQTHAALTQVDPVWHRIREEAEAAIAAEPLMGGLMHAGILHHSSFERALAYRTSMKLASREMSEQILREIFDEAYVDDGVLTAAARADLVAIFDRDPACHRLIQPLLFFKGFQAVQAYRLGHWLWNAGRKDLAYFVQMRVSEIFGVDIHPAARIGKGIMIDHAHSIVVGETAVVGDNVSMLHSVTLGGTGKEDDDRHPKIEDGVLIGAGAKVLGNITIGHCSRIAAGSVVLEAVPPMKTVAGVPARIVGESGCSQPSITMDHLFNSIG
jgi:serine O-acetyltransferase